MALPCFASFWTRTELCSRLALLLFLLASVGKPYTEAVALDAVAFQLSPPPALTGSLATNDVLLDAEQIHTDQIGTPHSYTAIGDNMYAVTDRGLVVNVAPCRPSVVANLRNRGCQTRRDCGHLISVRLGPDSLLYVLDAYRGLFEVHPYTGVVKLLYDTNTFVNGRPSVYLNDFVFLRDGTIVLSDASPTFDYDNEFWIRFEGKPDGRLLTYNVTDGKPKEILAGISYPTGLEVADDGRTLLVSEAGRARILRIDLRQDKFLQRSYFTENLPGMPEHIRRSGRETFWVGLSYPRYRGEVSITDRYSSKPSSRNFLAMRRSKEQLQLMYTKRGLAIELDDKGKLTRSFHDPTGLKIAEVLELTEYSAVLYVGTRAQRSTVRIVGSPNSLTVDSLVQVLRGRCQVTEDKIQETKASLQQKLNARKDKETNEPGATANDPAFPGVSNMETFPGQNRGQGGLNPGSRRRVSISEGLSALHRSLVKAPQRRVQGYTQPGYEQVPQQGSLHHQVGADFAPAYPNQGLNMQPPHQQSPHLPPPYQQQGPNLPPPYQQEPNLPPTYQQNQNLPPLYQQREMSNSATGNSPRQQMNVVFDDPFLPANGPQARVPLQRANRLPAGQPTQHNGSPPNQPHVVHSIHKGELVSHVILGKKAEAALAGNLLTVQRSDGFQNTPPINTHPPSTSPAPAQDLTPSRERRPETVTQQKAVDDISALGGFLGFVGENNARNSATVGNENPQSRQNPSPPISMPDQNAPGHLEPLHGIMAVPPPQADQHSQADGFSFPGLDQFTGSSGNNQEMAKQSSSPVNRPQSIGFISSSRQPNSSFSGHPQKRFEPDVMPNAIPHMQVFHPADPPVDSTHAHNQTDRNSGSMFQKKAFQLKQGLQQLHKIFQESPTAGQSQGNIIPEQREFRTTGRGVTSFDRGLSGQSLDPRTNDGHRFNPTSTRNRQEAISNLDTSSNHGVSLAKIHDGVINENNAHQSKQPLIPFSGAAAIHHNQQLNNINDKRFHTNSFSRDGETPANFSTNINSPVHTTHKQFPKNNNSETHTNNQQSQMDVNTGIQTRYIQPSLPNDHSSAQTTRQESDQEIRKSPLLPSAESSGAKYRIPEQFPNGVPPSTGFIQLYQSPGQYLLIPLTQSSLVQALRGLSASQVKGAQIVTSNGRVAQLTQLTKQLTQPTQQLTQPTQQLAQPTQQLSQPTQQLTQSTQQLTQPTQQLTQPTKQLTQLTQQLAQPTQQLTQSTQQLTQPTQQLTQSTQQFSEYTQQLTQPTQQLTQSTQQFSEYTQQLTQPTQSLTQPTQQIHQQSQQFDQVTQQRSQPAKPLHEPIKQVEGRSPHDGTSNTAHQSTQHLNSQSTQHLKSQSTQYLNPQSTQHLSPQSTQHLNPQSTQHLSPQSTQHLNPQSTQNLHPQFTQNLSPQSTQHTGPQSTQNLNAKSTQHLNSQLTQNLNPQTTQNLSPQSTQNLNAQPIQHLNPQFTHNLNPQSVQHIEPQSTQNRNAQSTQHPNPQFTQNLNPRSPQNLNPLSTQHLNLQTATASIRHSTQDFIQYSTQDVNQHSTQDFTKLSTHHFTQHPTQPSQQQQQYQQLPTQPPQQQQQYQQLPTQLPQQQQQYQQLPTQLPQQQQQYQQLPTQPAQQQQQYQQLPTQPPQQQYQQLPTQPPQQQQQYQQLPTQPAQQQQQYQQLPTQLPQQQQQYQQLPTQPAQQQQQYQQLPTQPPQQQYQQLPTQPPQQQYQQLPTQPPQQQYQQLPTQLPQQQQQYQQLPTQLPQQQQQYQQLPTQPPQQQYQQLPTQPPQQQQQYQQLPTEPPQQQQQYQQLPTQPPQQQYQQLPTQLPQQQQQYQQLPTQPPQQQYQQLPTQPAQQQYQQLPSQPPQQQQQYQQLPTQPPQQQYQQLPTQPLQQQQQYQQLPTQPAQQQQQYQQLPTQPPQQQPEQQQVSNYSVSHISKFPTQLRVQQFTHPATDSVHSGPSLTRWQSTRQHPSEMTRYSRTTVTNTTFPQQHPQNIGGHYSHFMDGSQQETTQDLNQGARQHAPEYSGNQQGFPKLLVQRLPQGLTNEGQEINQLHTRKEVANSPQDFTQQAVPTYNRQTTTAYIQKVAFETYSQQQADETYGKQSTVPSYNQQPVVEMYNQPHYTYFRDNSTHNFTPQPLFAGVIRSTEQQSAHITERTKSYTQHSDRGLNHTPVQPARERVDRQLTARNPEELTKQSFQNVREQVLLHDSAQSVQQIPQQVNSHSSMYSIDQPIQRTSQQANINSTTHNLYQPVQQTSEQSNSDSTAHNLNQPIKQAFQQSNDQSLPGNLQLSDDRSQRSGNQLGQSPTQDQQMPLRSQSSQQLFPTRQQQPQPPYQRFTDHSNQFTQQPSQQAIQHPYLEPPQQIILPIQGANTDTVYQSSLLQYQQSTRGILQGTENQSTKFTQQTTQQPSQHLNQQTTQKSAQTRLDTETAQQLVLKQQFFTQQTTQKVEEIPEIPNGFMTQ